VIQAPQGDKELLNFLQSTCPSLMLKKIKEFSKEISRF
jgi:hypothetical protein